MGISKGSRLLFMGDSVTDCGRARPVGAGSAAALGEGYVAQIDAVLSGPGPGASITVVNMGTSGDTVRDLSRRWTEDVLGQHPDWLSVMIGINDVWRQFDLVDRSAAVLPEEFAETYERLVSGTLPRLKGLFLLTPFYVQPDRTDPMRKLADAYGAIVKNLALRHSVRLVDIQAEMDRALKTLDYRALAEDRVHPTPLGHGIIAQAFLSAIGGKGRGNATPLSP